MTRPFAVAALVVASLLLAALAVYSVRAVARRRLLFDHPNVRSAHLAPTPRLGGVGLMAAFIGCAVAWLAASPSAGAWPIVIGTAAVAALGFADDLRPIRARFRFAAQLLAAAAVVWARRDALTAGVSWVLQLPAWLLAPLVILWILWMTNLFNFMDGIDGLAGGQAVLAALGLAAAAFLGGAPQPGVLLLLLAAASLGFLVFNFPPASIFMGDAGSTAIGFFLACAPLLPGEAAIPVEVVWIAAGLFVLDATTTLARRVTQGERWFEAHRSHWYQRPLTLGVPHRTITLVAWAAMAVLALAAGAWPLVSPQARLALLLLPLALFVPLTAVVRRLEAGSPEATRSSR